MIDLWDLKTLPAVTLALVNDNADLIRDYFAREAFIMEFRRTSTLWDEIPTNEFHDRKMELEAEVRRSIMLETIRGFHYTRMTDGEVHAIQSRGILVTSLPMFREKLDAVVAAGLMAQEASEHVYDNSPLVTGDYGDRAGTFYAAAHPYPVDDSGITPFHESWGGEISRWAIEDEAILENLRALGKPRVIEVAMPIALTGWVASRLAEQIIAVKGHEPQLPGGFGADISINEPLPAANILRVHTQGDPDFEAMGRGYPLTYGEPAYKDEG